MATSPSLPPQPPSSDRSSDHAVLAIPAARSQSSPVRWFLRLLGPSLISGAANDDPCAVGTAAAAGAAFGFSFLWTAIFTFPMMAATVFLCSKLGVVSEMGIAGVIRRHYPRWLLYGLLFGVLVANILEAGADIGAIAASLGLLLPVPVIGITVGITVIILVIQAWGSYSMLQKIFKWLSVALFSYVGAAVLAKPELGKVLGATFRPALHFDRAYLAMLVAIIGARLSPYVYFWQPNQFVEQKNAVSELRVYPTTPDEQLRYAAWDVNIGMFFSNFIMYFIILCTAATLFRAGDHHIDSAYNAAQALRPLAGRAASLLFTAGLVGVGILAIPVLTTGPAYALAESFGWSHGLHRSPGHAPEFYAVIALSTCVALAIAFSGINPINALLWASVLMGQLAPPLLIILMLITNNRKIMGERVNGIWMNILGWGTTVAISLAAVGLFWTWLK